MKYKVSLDITMSKILYDIEAETTEQAQRLALERVKAEPYYYAAHADSFVKAEVDDCDEDEDDADADDDPAQEVYAAYSPAMRKAVAYINEQLEPEDKAIIAAQVDKNFNRHMNPAYGIDEGKIIDLLEEYGDDHDLGEGWWENECELDDIVLLIQSEN